MKCAWKRCKGRSTTRNEWGICDDCLRPPFIDRPIDTQFDRDRENDLILNPDPGGQ